MSNCSSKCDCECHNNNPLRELGLKIADHGEWEEFHQKRNNFTMFDYHKAERLKLQKEYNQLKSKIQP